MNAGTSIESTIINNLKQGSIHLTGLTTGNSPKLPNLPVKMTSRNVYVQKKQNIGARNPFVLHTERTKPDPKGPAQGVRGVGII